MSVSSFILEDFISLDLPSQHGVVFEIVQDGTELWGDWEAREPIPKAVLWAWEFTPNAVLWARELTLTLYCEHESLPLTLHS